jgi:hypothetical protein
MEGTEVTFANSIDALLHAVRSRGDMREVHANLRQLRNGVRHCNVQVFCKDGVEFHIEAYGEEADALYQEVRKQSEKKKGQVYK